MQRFSGGAAACLNGPNRYQPIVAYQMIIIVQIDGGIAVRNRATHHLARIEPPLVRGVHDAALLVAEEEITRAGGRAADNLGGTRIRGECFETRVRCGESGAIGTDNRGLYKE